MDLCEFKARLVYRASSGKAGTKRETLPQKYQKKGKNHYIDKKEIFQGFNHKSLAEFQYRFIVWEDMEQFVFKLV